MLRGKLLVSGIGVAVVVLAVSVGGRPRAGGENEVRAFPLKAVQLMTSGGARLQDLSGAAPANSPSPPASDYSTFVQRNCILCHNARLRTADLSFDRLELDDISVHRETWEKVVAKLRAGLMPPPARPRPDAAALASFVAYLETELDRAAVAEPDPGRPVPRRLNGTEYANAIRDLLAVEIAVDELLPGDELQYGFDNIGAALSVTPVAMEKYLSAAHLISELAVGPIGEDIPPSASSVTVHPYLLQEGRMSEDLPFGSRGGVAIPHYFPADGEYTVKVTLQRNERGYVRGLLEPHYLDIRLDGRRIELFTIGGGPKMATPGAPFVRAGVLGDEESELYQLHEVDVNLAARFSAKAGQGLLAITFQNENLVPEYPVFRPRNETILDRIQWRGGNPAIEQVEIRGPDRVTAVGDTPSRQKVFVCQPAGIRDEEPCARRILSTLARRAYRRPVTDEGIRLLLDVYRVGREEAGFKAGIRAALARMLVGPEFLFRVEHEPATAPPGGIYRISDLELASRLSFFLWSSIPDDELLDVAESGRLRDPAELEKQVRRLLADPRAARALSANFGAQWLHLRNLSASQPDVVLFPEFDENLREAMRQETEFFLESMVREDQSILRLLDANYTFLNDRLARHYGIPNVYGNHLRRVPLSPEFDARRGLLGQSALLTVTSYANRTSVVLRGHWVLDKFLNAPPPPPPPNVPPLEKTGEIGELPLRELLEMHRANPACMGCHAPMDPLGFALENFDAIGRWRTVDAGVTIDASAVLPDGTAFEGPAGLRSLLLREPERFAATVTERLLTYALGRGLTYKDAPTVREITRQAAQDDYRWSSLILAVVKSVPFQMTKVDRVGTAAD